MKKIVFFTARDLSNVGGGERMLSLIANGLCADYDITILTPYKSAPYYKFDNQVNVETLGFLYQQSSWKRKVQYLSILKALKAYLSNTNADYFIASSSMAITLTSIVCKSNDERLYAWMHTSYFAPTPKLLKWLDNRNLKKFKVISINTMDMEEYKKLTKDVFRIPNPLPFSSEQKSSRTEKRIISVGRLEHGKRFDLLIDICHKVFKNIPEWYLDIYGQDDGERDKLIEKIRTCGMEDRIRINNPIPNIHEEYLKSSIFLTTTQIEAFPLVLLEACECGLPCICYDVPSGPRDIIKNGYNGYLVTDLDAETYCVQLSSLMQSQGVRDELGVNAINKAKEFKTSNVLAQWKALLNYHDK